MPRETDAAGLRLRTSEVLLLSYFFYAVVLTLAFGLLIESIVKAVALLLSALVFFAILARRAPKSAWRDWSPPLILLAAYRELELFARHTPGHLLENSWQAIDRVVLNEWHLRGAIEGTGWLLPSYLELTYLLVYGIGFFLMLAVYRAHRRDIADRVLFVYLLGTLLAYAIIPFFPCVPPRSLFADSDPHVMTPLRQLNLLIVNHAGVHTGVFPSAHVSSAFSAAWALLFLVPERRREAWGMLIYAISVAVATVYGRYHYAVDAVAGFAVSLTGAAIAIRIGVIRNHLQKTQTV
jgi:membrane-associated phospholipid phosphatase